MKHEIGKGLFIGAGLFLLAAGLGMGGYGAWMMTHLDEPVDRMALRSEMTEQCKSLALREGYRVVHKGSELTLADTGLEDHESRLYRASWITQACEGFVMTQFCMGEDCAQQGPDQFALTLSYSDDGVRGVKKPVATAPKVDKTARLPASDETIRDRKKQPRK